MNKDDTLLIRNVIKDALKKCDYKVYLSSPTLAFSAISVNRTEIMLKKKREELNEIWKRVCKLCHKEYRKL